MKRVARDLGKHPAERLPIEVEPLDPDLVSNRSRSEDPYHMVDRPVLGDSPDITAWIIETNGCAPFVNEPA